ncbi:ABC-F family ATP-binding cassette domain-containing protein [Bacillus carboniphilus]|uniref:ABC-F family ATP-binding cassette domain-containing protein n=1 Tax=Bacillus carboniphilus TaxID=86663 RepID=A0ABY9JUY5_9BACI|nr:ABC-F family ATP-binding cassette domain-containing protein [Bacillus carboniphilus]WLR43211.1 ABC-F family ATP-binding cassette domain-containing protein [Bacillus carboniphilus]
MLLLEAKNIEKYYSDRLIIKVDELCIYRGQRIGIVGENGQGKSTLLKMLVNELKPDQGTIHSLCSIGYIPQIEGDPELPSNLSGGERTKEKIKESLSTHCDLLVADEPTTHLDLPSIEFLEKKLKEFAGAVLVISHDQELLNEVCGQIWEVDRGELTVFQGNYQDYVIQKKALSERQTFEYQQYVKEKNRLQKAAIQKSEKSKALKKAPSRMGNSEARLHKRKTGQKKAKLDKGVKAIESRIAQLDKKEKPKQDDEIRFDLQYFRPIHNKRVVTFDKVKANAGLQHLFSGLSGAIRPGEKVAITGLNGAGKSTLLNMIANKQDGILISKSARVGLFDQMLDNLDETKTLLENVKNTSPYPEEFIRTVLARLLFKRETVKKYVSMLSGGERVKAALAKVFLGDFNVLLLDEPTNFLDLQTKQSLIEVLKVYPGTIIFVSHDRSFIKHLATHLIVIENHQAMLKEEEGLVKKQKVEVDQLKIEMELSELIGKLSLEQNPDKKKMLEKRYEELIMMKSERKALQVK